jgi:hypothetical protein
MKLEQFPPEFLNKDDKNYLESIKTQNLDQQILSGFSPEEALEIKQKQKILSSLAYFVGKDFDIPVLLNPPGGGWFWDFEKNEIKIDAQDVLDKPIDYLRYVICHEAGHRRISRVRGVIPDEDWRQKGFPFMMNAIEDCRNDNFVAEAYPRYKDQAIFAHDLIDRESKIKEQAQEKLGQKPKSILAGLEYIRQWMRELKGDNFDIDDSLPNDVQEVVRNTLGSAQNVWWRYPSKQEADEGEEIIEAYAKRIYEIAVRKIWPEFKKLVDEDIKNQELNEAIQQMLDDLNQQPDESDESDESGGRQGSQEESDENGEGGHGETRKIPESLERQLTEKEKEELEKAIEESLASKDEKVDSQESPADSEQKASPISIDSLSEELKQKIREYIESLPQEQQEQIRKEAEKAIQEFEKEISEEFQGKLLEDLDDGEQNTEGDQHSHVNSEKIEQSETSEIKDKINQVLNADKNSYERARQEVLPVIGKLENDLREIFVKRRSSKWQSGFKVGKRIDIKKRIQEKAKGVSAVESRSWQKRERPLEKDYAISLLVDLSNSMRGEKIQETFKATVALAEVLNRLSINLEILGFHDEIREYQKFGNGLDKDTREKMGEVLQEVSTNHALYNDDGWALGQASKRLEEQKAAEKFLIVLSDGIPEPSNRHSGIEYDLGRVVSKISDETDQKLIGLGIGSGTNHVEKFYPSSVAGVGVKEMSQKLSDLIREVIENYDNF